MNQHRVLRNSKNLHQKDLTRLQVFLSQLMKKMIKNLKYVNRYLVSNSAMNQAMELEHL